VTDDTQSTRLYSKDINGIETFETVLIDGNEMSISDIDEHYGYVELSNGNHTIKFALKDKTLIPPNTFLMYMYGDEKNVLTNVVIPNSVTTIGYRAFENSGLTSVIIPDSVTTIGNEAFICKNLTDVTIGSGVENIGAGAFGDCPSLTNLTINCPTVKSGWFNGLSVDNVTLGENVQTIEDGAFCGCEYVNSEDRATIETYNENAFCETYCVMVTFADDVQTADLGESGAYSYAFDNGTMIPKEKIIRVTKSSD
jgi:hypothetical protein